MLVGGTTHIVGHHTSFKYNGILFENHGTDVKWDFNFCRSDYRVLGFLDRHAADALPGPEGFMMLPPAVTAVFLVKHLKQHLRWNVKVNVKQFTDLALLLQVNPGIMDDVLSGLKSVGLPACNPGCYSAAPTALRPM